EAVDRGQEDEPLGAERHALGFQAKSGRSKAGLMEGNAVEHAGSCEQVPTSSQRIVAYLEKTARCSRACTHLLARLRVEHAEVRSLRVDKARQVVHRASG